MHNKLIKLIAERRIVLVNWSEWSLAGFQATFHVYITPVSYTFFIWGSSQCAQMISL